MVSVLGPRPGSDYLLLPCSHTRHDTGRALDVTLCPAQHKHSQSHHSPPPPIVFINLNVIKLLPEFSNSYGVSNRKKISDNIWTR